MRLLVIGKNSGLYQDSKSEIAKYFEILEFGSKDFINLFKNLFFNEITTIIIFSGLVTNDNDKLKEIEKFHHKLINIIHKIDYEQLILISSSAVYGNYKVKFSERDLPKPKNKYGLSKYNIELLYSREFISKLSILRLGNYIGLDTLGKKIIKSVNNEITIDVNKYKKSVDRTYLDKKILSRSIFEISKRLTLENKILNIGSSSGANIEDIAKFLGAKISYRIVDDFYLNDIILDVSELEKLIGKLEVKLNESNSNCTG